MNFHSRSIFNMIIQLGQLLFVCLVFIWICFACDDLSIEEYDAIQDLYDSLNGANWTITWQLNASDINSPCSAFGVRCRCSVNNTWFVEEIDIQYNNLVGTLPNSIGNLINVATIALGNNHIGGTIPESIANITLLYTLSIEQNELTGPLPKSFPQWKSLISLSASHNSLTGTLPSFPKNKTFYSFEMTHNSLTGTIPMNFLLPEYMADVQLSSNFLEGTLPDVDADIGRYLYTFVCYDNMITGTLPVSWSHMTSLNDYEISDNFITGTFPIEYAEGMTVSSLKLGSNFMHGHLFENLAVMHSYVLTILCAHNYFSGSIPNSYSAISTLNNLITSYNFFTGTLPNLSRASQLILNDNLFTGTFFTIRQNMFNMNISANFLTGTLSFDRALEVTDLSLGNNMFTGGLFIDNSFPTLPKLHILEIQNNYFSSTISSKLSTFTKLYSFYIYNNYISGPIPSDLSPLATLSFFWLSNNIMSSTVPSSVGTLQNLIELLIDENFFSGVLLNSLNATNQPSLEVVNIQNNLFSGNIPGLAYKFSGLSVAIYGSNCFHGTIPTSLCEASNLRVLSLDGLGSSAKCHDSNRINRIPALSIPGNFKASFINSELPECLLRMNLTELHLAGNDLFGTLPEIPENSSLIDLSLSNNGLTGTIPKSIQLHEFKTQLNLGYNKLCGTLLPNFQVNSQMSTLRLNHNRLSGFLPKSIARSNDNPNLSDLHVLSGNIFDCPYGLPSKDPYSGSYYCGSTKLNDTLYTWLALVFSVFLVIILIGSLLKSMNNHQSLASIASNSRVMRCLGSSWIEVHRDLENLANWWTKCSELKTGSYLNSKASANKLPQTRSYLAIQSFFRVLSRVLILVSIVIVAPGYVIMFYKFGIVDHAYAYVVSMAYLHGFTPLIFCGTLVVVILTFTAYILSTNYIVMKEFINDCGKDELDNSKNNINSNNDSTSSASKDNIDKVASTDESRLIATSQRVFWEVLYRLFNVVVTLAVNGAYIHSILQGNTMSKSSIMIIQISVSAFKVFWTSVYIPFAYNHLRTFMSDSEATGIRFMMSIFNLIAAPCLASVFSDQSCFYNAFVPYDPVLSSSVVLVCNLFDTDSFDPVCIGYGFSVFDSHFHPAYMYSYTCGTSILISYIPVFLFFYCYMGIFDPLIRILIILHPKLYEVPRKWITMLFKKKDQLTENVDEYNNIRKSLDGMGAMVSVMQHTTVLLTFGLTCPLLGIPIAISIIIASLSDSLKVGHEVWMASFIYQLSNPTDFNHRTMIPTPSESNDIRIIENSVKDSWEGAQACSTSLFATVSIFWSFMFFDMIAEKFGSTNGIIVVIVFGIVLFALTYFVKLHIRHNVSSHHEPAIYVHSFLGSEYPKYMESHNSKEHDNDIDFGYARNPLRSVEMNRVNSKALQ